MTEIFFETFFSLARLSLGIQDNFFQEKLVKKTKDFFDSYNHVAQSGQQLFKIISDLDELVEVIAYLKLVDLSLALLAQKSLLRLRSDLLGVLPKPKKEGRKTGVKNIKNKYSSQRLLDYLKTKPDGAQAIEVARHFENQLSRRTVQRYLNELASRGLIKKDQTDGFPKYFST